TRALRSRLRARGAWHRWCSPRRMLRTSLLVLVVVACGSPHRTSGPADAELAGSDSSSCATENIKAALVPLDLYIMLDRSSSMRDVVAGGGSKWDAVTSALDTFVQQPGLTGVSVGLQFFGVNYGAGSCKVVSCVTDADCGAAACGPCKTNLCVGTQFSGADSCSAADYADANVEIAA